MHLLIFTQNNVAPAQYGGGLRVSGLARQLLERGDKVSVIRFVSPGEAPSEKGGLFQVHDVPTPRAYPMAALASMYHMLSKKAINLALELNKIEPITVVQSCPPWASSTGGRVARMLGVPHLVLSQNCETNLARQFSQDGAARKLPIVGNLLANFNVELLRRAEKSSIEQADLTLTPSAGDIAEMKLVGINTERVVVLPNGTDSAPVPAVRRATRSVMRIREDEPVALFVGRMDYLPNRDAIDSIINTIAPVCPNVKFLLVGSNPPDLKTAPNVVLVGQVESVDPYLAAADISLVPLSRGSGTRIKILDAWAAGLPVISTPEGASGLAYKHGENILIADTPEAFPSVIAELLTSPALMQTLKKGALAAATPYTWAAIGSEYIAALDTLAAGRSQKSLSNRKDAVIKAQVAA